jgi:hypothetical protein
MAGRFARVETRRRTRGFLLGLLADLPRKNCWTIAEHAADRLSSEVPQRRPVTRLGLHDTGQKHPMCATRDHLADLTFHDSERVLQQRHTTMTDPHPTPANFSAAGPERAKRSAR